MTNILKNIGFGIFKQSHQYIWKTKHAQRIELKCLSTKLSSDINYDNEETASGPDNPLMVEDYFQVRKLFTITDLFNARVHYGHKLGSLNNYMLPYIFGERLGHLIIDLDITTRLLTQALNFTAHVAYRDGIILFISQTPQHSFLIENTAKECHQFAHTRHWRPGMFTNSTMIFGATTRLPDLCIILNTLTTVLDQHLAVSESAKMAIPVVGVVDTNCDPKLVTYPIPGNDDSPASIELYCHLFKTVILKAKEIKAKHEQGLN